MIFKNLRVFHQLSKQVDVFPGPHRHTAEEAAVSAHLARTRGLPSSARTCGFWDTAAGNKSEPAVCFLYSQVTFEFLQYWRESLRQTLYYVSYIPRPPNDLRT